MKTIQIIKDGKMTKQYRWNFFVCGGRGVKRVTSIAVQQSISTPLIGYPLCTHTQSSPYNQVLVLLRQMRLALKYSKVFKIDDIQIEISFEYHSIFKSKHFLIWIVIFNYNLNTFDYLIKSILTEYQSFYWIVVKIDQL